MPQALWQYGTEGFKEGKICLKDTGNMVLRGLRRTSRQYDTDGFKE